MQQAVAPLDKLQDKLHKASADMRHWVRTMPKLADVHSIDAVAETIARFRDIAESFDHFGLPTLHFLCDQLQHTLLDTRNSRGFGRLYILKLAEWLKNAAIFLQYPQQPTAEVLLTLLPEASPGLVQQLLAETQAPGVAPPGTQEQTPVEAQSMQTAEFNASPGTGFSLGDIPHEYDDSENMVAGRKPDREASSESFAADLWQQPDTSVVPADLSGDAMPDEVLDLLCLAEQEIREQCQVLEQTATASTQGLSDALVAHLDNFAMLGEVLENPDLEQYCKRLSAHIQNARYEAPERDLAWRHVPDWLKAVVAYIKNAEANPLPPVEMIFSTDVEVQRLEPQVQVYAPDATVMGFDFESGELYLHGAQGDTESTSSEAQQIWQVLSQVLHEAEAELSVAVQQIIQTSPQASHHGIEQFSMWMERIQEALRSVNLPGLLGVVDFVRANLENLQDLGADERLRRHGVFVEWLEPVYRYLDHHDDEQTYLGIVNFLEDQRWPQTVNGAQWRHLFTELANGIVGAAAAAEAPEPDAIEDDELRYDISADANPAIVEAFFIEAPGQCTELIERVAQLGGAQLTKQVEAAQRLAHTLKGSANLIGVTGMAELAHQMEEVFEKIALGRIADIPFALQNSLQEAADGMAAMVDQLRGDPVERVNIMPVLRSLRDWGVRLQHGYDEAAQEYSVAEEETSPQNDAPQSNPFMPLALEYDPARLVARVDPVEVLPVLGHSNTRQEEVRRVSRLAPEQKLSVAVSALDDMMRLVGESSIAFSQTQQKLNNVLAHGAQMRQHERLLQERRFELEELVDVRGIAAKQRRSASEQQDASPFDSLEMDQYDDLYETVHRYIEAVADYRAIAENLQKEVRALDGIIVSQKRINKEIEQSVMSTRMIPVDNISARLQRSIRQAARMTGKQVVLEIEGTDLMVASELLTRLADPIMHMLRNAVDHGIEPPQERSHKSKAPEGRVKLAFRQEGNHLVVRCSDDGRGLDYRAIRQTAMAKGLITDNQELENADLARMILAPGFSTRDKATQVSGRGIGMDVVHSTVVSMKGTVNIEDAEEGGAAIALRLPINFITSHCLVVLVDGARFAIPTDRLARILAPGTGKLSHMGPEVTFELDKEIYNVTSMSTMLRTGTGVINPSKTILLARGASGVHAVSVDYAQNSYELVIKNLGRYIRHVHGVSGVSILGDGSLVPVLDVYEMLSGAGDRVYDAAVVNQQTNKTKTVAKTQVRTLLIVDDSLSARTALAESVRGMGFEILQARDGLEAIGLLAQKPQIALVDMEMPRMNGLELTRHIRNQPEYKAMPVIMLTSRAQYKHRQTALEAGVDVYMTKPYNPEQLAQTIDQLLTRAQSGDGAPRGYEEHRV